MIKLFLLCFLLAQWPAPFQAYTTLSRWRRYSSNSDLSFSRRSIVEGSTKPVPRSQAFRSQQRGERTHVPFTPKSKRQSVIKVQVVVSDDNDGNQPFDEEVPVAQPEEKATEEDENDINSYNLGDAASQVSSVLEAIDHLRVFLCGGIGQHNDNDDMEMEMHQVQDCVKRARDNLYCTIAGATRPSIEVHTNLQTPAAAGTSQQSVAIPGASGRAVLLMLELKQGSDVTGFKTESVLEYIRSALGNELDEWLEQNGYKNQPIIPIVDIIEKGEDAIADPFNEEKLQTKVRRFLKKYARDYSLCQPVLSSSASTQMDDLKRKPPRTTGEQAPSTRTTSTPVPSLHVQLDGAFTSQDWWDTSDVYVFDNLVKDNLRQSLYQVVNGKEPWDDVKQGPNPAHWERGSLNDAMTITDEQEESGGCWGLSYEATEELCFHHHDAIEKFEQILQQELFPEFHVCRLPEAVLGDSISPLNANAATHGDEFEWHIDADPNLTPPSPWCDIYGRYPNRVQGKPRFVSCLIYLNEEWKADEQWGGGTRFYDPPTESYYEVDAQPGRVVIMDQDITHTVTAPHLAAGEKRPRYSLVWKLILHPKTIGQDMSLFSKAQRHASSRTPSMPWPDTFLFGSANGAEE
jgi:hypothetical protein